MKIKIVISVLVYYYFKFKWCNNNNRDALLMVFVIKQLAWQIPDIIWHVLVLSNMHNFV